MTYTHKMCIFVHSRVRTLRMYTPVNLKSPTVIRDRESLIQMIKVESEKYKTTMEICPMEAIKSELKYSLTRKY